jgi:hypothetical protein
VVIDKVPIIVQLGDGLQLLGFMDAIAAHHQKMKPLFCLSQNTGIDDDTFISYLKVQFSDLQQKKKNEEETYKHFADFISHLCYEGMQFSNVCTFKHLNCSYYYSKYYVVYL